MNIRTFARIDAAFRILFGMADPDDTKLGYSVRRTIEKMEIKAEADQKLYFNIAAKAMCNIAHDSNAEKIEVNIEKLTYKGVDIGDWHVEARKKE